MDSNDLSTLSQKTVNIERWIIPILAVMIVVVGGIRMTPWIKSKLPSVYGSTAELEQDLAPEIGRDLNHTNAQQTNDIRIDTDLAPLITEQDVPLNEVRSQKLTKSLSGSRSEQSIQISIDSDDFILTEDISAPDPGHRVNHDISALEAITGSQNKPRAFAATKQSSKRALEQGEQKPETSPTQTHIKANNGASENDAQSRKDRNEQLIATLVRDWAAAWSSGSPGHYFEFYSPDMSTKQYPSYGQWRAWRKSRLVGPKQIDVEINELEVRIELAAPWRARATFVQHYRADAYSDSVVKQLNFALRNGRWLISKEQTLRAF